VALKKEEDKQAEDSDKDLDGSEDKFINK